MKIIDRTKDYYDYLQGVYGMDTHAVFDREMSVVLHSDCWKERFGDTYEEPDKRWWNDNHNHIFYILECGFVQYLICLELCRNGQWKSELVHTFSDNRHYKKHPLTIYFVEVYRSFFRKTYDFTNIKYANDIRAMSRWRDKNMENSDIELPILKDTDIPALIPPEEIWWNLYDYLLKMKETEVADTRTDIQKLEGKGFDKTTSFRHPVK